MITHFCLGTGESGCKGCQKEKNWQLLNQLPDALRLAMQKQAQRIIDDECILNGRLWYELPTQRSK